MLPTYEQILKLNSTIKRKYQIKQCAGNVGFSGANSKIEKLAKRLGIPVSRTYVFNLPACYSCPGASICKAKADPVTGEITDGKGARVRCFWASLEAAFKNVRVKGWLNFLALLGAGNAKAMYRLMEDAFPKGARLVRIHSGGDMFSLAYLRAWMMLAQAHPECIFYGYTKSINFLVKAGPLPDNLFIQCSHGGKYDALIGDRPTAYIVLSEAEADALGVPVAGEDAESEQWVLERKSFAMLVHGTQKAGTEAAKAWDRIKAARHA